MCCRLYPTLFLCSFLIRQICKLAKRVNCRKTVKFRPVPLRAPFFVSFFVCVCGFVLLLHSLLTFGTVRNAQFFRAPRILRMLPVFYSIFFLFFFWLINSARRESHRLNNFSSLVFLSNCCCVFFCLDISLFRAFRFSKSLF